MMHSCNARRTRALAGAAAAAVLIACAAYGTARAAGESIDYGAIAAIKQIGLDPQKSQVMEIAAAFAYLASNREEKLPRKPMPAAIAGTPSPSAPRR